MLAFSGSIYCPDSHPYACGGGTKCTNSLIKPHDGSDPDCDGGVVDLYRVVEQDYASAFCLIFSRHIAK